jgi:hypothetical protein
MMQLRALQLSDRWTPAVQRATRPLAKPVQIVGALGVRAAANANRNAALSTSGHESGPPRMPIGAVRPRLWLDVTIREPHPAGCRS